MATPNISKNITYSWQYQPYISWKGNNYNKSSFVNTRPETNGSWNKFGNDANAFLARPIKHWRKQLAADKIRGGTSNISIQDINVPGLYTLINKECCDISNNSSSIVSGIQEKNNTCCNPQANLIKYKTAPLERNYISYTSYFKNRCYNYNQNISTTKIEGNTYFTSDGIATYPTDLSNGCQNFEKKYCENCGVQNTIYKPNNRQFSKQGGTSGKSRINALRENTINPNGALFNNAYGLKQINNGICGLNGDSLYYVKTKPTPYIQIKCGPAFFKTYSLVWSVASGLQFTREGNNIVYNGNRWVAVGGGGYSMLYSNDGITWNDTSGTKFNAETGGRAVFYANNLWVAVGSGGVNTILYSDDGTTWSVSSGVLFTSNGNSIYYGNNKWVALGYDAGLGGNTILYSLDGKTNWSVASGTLFTAYGNYLIYKDGLWVAVGRGTNTILYSDNGIIWKPSTGVNFSFEGNSIEYANDVWVAVGEGGYSILYSTNGMHWNIATGATFSIRGNSVRYANGIWVAVGRGVNNILYSTNGINWSTVSGTQFLSPFLSGNDVYYGVDRWVATGIETPTQTVTSIDGINWMVPKGTGFSIAGFGKKVLYGNRWVALGYGINGKPTIIYGEIIEEITILQ